MRFNAMFIHALFLQVPLLAQSISPGIIANGGVSGVIAGGYYVSGSTGQALTVTGRANGGWVTGGFQQSLPLRVVTLPKVFLEGPFVSATSTMADNLRAANSIPLTEPYSTLGLPQVAGGGEHTTAGVLAVTGNGAVVDWVHVQLRSSNGTTVLATRNGLLKRNGSIVDVDGTSSLTFIAPPGPYRIAVFHRNHLPVMTANPINLGAQGATLDFSNPATATNGTGAQKTIGSVQAMWAGDITGNRSLAYIGAGNDRDPILVAVGGTTPNNTLVNQYRREDVNMDGMVKYTGSANDRDPILVNVGGTTPNNVRVGQVP